MTRKYGISSTSLLGQGPVAGAMISQKSTQGSGMVGGFDARGNAGVVKLSGGLNTQAVAGMQGLLHARVGVNVALPYGLQVTPGFAVGYSSGIMEGGANLSRMRVTPSLAVAFGQSVRLTYRQSPWALGAGNNAPRDIPR